MASHQELSGGFYGPSGSHGPHTQPTRHSTIPVQTSGARASYITPPPSLRSVQRIQPPVTASLLSHRTLLHSFGRISRPQHIVHRYFSITPWRRSAVPPEQQPSSSPKPSLLKRENIYTIPNALTISRICACPILGWSILQGDFHLATGLLVYAGLTDLVCPFQAISLSLSNIVNRRTDILLDIIRCRQFLGQY